MSKHHAGRFIAFAAIAGAVAAGVSYLLQYKSFHKELDEDFHEFEDDFDEFDDGDVDKTPAKRSYVSLTPETDELREDAENLKDAACSAANAAEQVKEAVEEDAEQAADKAEQDNITVTETKA